MEHQAVMPGLTPRQALLIERVEALRKRLCARCHTYRRVGVTHYCLDCNAAIWRGHHPPRQMRIPGA